MIQPKAIIRSIYQIVVGNIYGFANK